MTPVLDAFQERVVQHQAGPAVCIAAAGSGKSFVLIERTRRLLQEGESPRSICVLVYNREAAVSFRDRLQLACGDRSRGVTVSTFHSWCLHLLHHWFPRDPRFVGATRVMGATGSKIRAGDLVFSLKNEKGPNGAELYPLAASLDQILSGCDLLAESMIDLRPDAPPLTAIELELAQRLLGTDRLDAWLKFLKALQAKKEQQQAIAFSDMIFGVANSIKVTPDAPHVAPLRTLFRHIMVDEGQDMNRGFIQISCFLAAGATSALWVGDPCQSINGFMGAVESALQDRVAEGAQFYTLPINRRSSEAILDLANAIVRGMPWNLNGDCLPRPNVPPGPVPALHREQHSHAGAQLAAELAAEAIRNGETVAILCRVNADLIPVESTLVVAGFAVQNLGERGGAWEGQMGRYLYAYLAATSSGRSTAELYDIVNVPKRFASRAGLFAALKDRAVSTPGQLAVALEASPQQGVARFGREVRMIAALPWPNRVSRCVQLLQQGIREREKDTPQVAEDHCEALAVLGELAEEHGSLEALDAYRKQAASIQGRPVVVLSSVHRAKGMQWGTVIGLGMNSDRFPHHKADNIDEERRLLYVLVTRAAQNLHLIGTSKKLSPFLLEPHVAACLSEP